MENTYANNTILCECGYSLQCTCPRKTTLKKTLSFRSVVYAYSQIYSSILFSVYIYIEALTSIILCNAGVINRGMSLDGEFFGPYFNFFFYFSLHGEFPYLNRVHFASSLHCLFFVCYQFAFDNSISNWFD